MEEAGGNFVAKDIISTRAVFDQLNRPNQVYGTPGGHHKGAFGYNIAISFQTIRK